MGRPPRQRGRTAFEEERIVDALLEVYREAGRA